MLSARRAGAALVAIASFAAVPFTATTAGAEEVAEPTLLTILDPITDPILDPILDPITDPITDPIIDPITDPIPDPILDPILDPIDLGVCGSAGGGSFTDILRNVHQVAIDCITANGITQGGPAGLPFNRFGPGLDVRRDQMASFITRLIDGVAPGVLPAAPVGNLFDCDLGLDNAHFEAIQRLASAGVVLGGPGGTSADCFGPDQVVHRDQMTSFINRAIELVTGTALSSVTDHFTDDDASVHRLNIDALAANGIVAGTGGSEYSPLDLVRRDQMASFVARTLAFLS